VICAARRPGYPRFPQRPRRVSTGGGSQELLGTGRPALQQMLRLLRRLSLRGVQIVAQSVAQGPSHPLENDAQNSSVDPAISQENQRVRPRTRPMWRIGWTKLATWSRPLSQCRPSPVSTLLLAGWGRPIRVLSEHVQASQSKAAAQRRCAAACCMQEVQWDDLAEGKFRRSRDAPPPDKGFSDNADRQPLPGSRAELDNCATNPAI